MRFESGLAPDVPICWVFTAMMKLCIFAGTTILSYVFWYLGELVGLQFVGCFLLSGVGSIVGVWAGWKLGRRFE